MAHGTTLAWTLLVAIGAPAHHIFYFDRPIPLALDGSRLAVKIEAERAPPAEVLAAHGLDPSGAQAMPVSGWHLLPLDAASLASRTVEDLVADLGADGRAGFVSPVFVGDDGGPLVVTPDLLVGFKPDVPRTEALGILAETGAGAIVDIDWAGMPGAYRVRSASRSGLEVLSTANRLASLPETSFAEPDMLFSGGPGGGLPNDQLFDEQWGLHNTGQSAGCAGIGVDDIDMDCPEAWEITIGADTIKVVIIDTGVQQDHPDLHQVPGMDTTSQGGDGGPHTACENHGTPVAGCVSAVGNNVIGVSGVAPGCVGASVRTFIADVEACDGSWNSQSSWTVAALAWAEMIGARVTNNSNYYGFTSGAIASKYAETRDAGMVHFASAGNFADSEVTYPASLPSVNAIAAIDSDGDLGGFSNFGPELFMSGPGVDIATTDRTGNEGYSGTDYTCVNGTSFASPNCAGVAALILSVEPTLGAAEVEALMQTTAADLGPAGFDTTFGWGLANARAPLEQDLQPPPNDLCAMPRVVGDGFTNFSTLLAGTDGPVEPVCGFEGDGQIGADVWFTYTAACTSDTLVRLCDSLFDTRLAVYGRSCPAGSGEVIACNDDSCGTKSQVNVSMVAGAQYTIRIGSGAGQTGSGTMFIFPTCEPACPADVNGDGLVDVQDLTAVVLAWDTADPNADITGDGSVDVQDLTALVLAWGECG